MPAPQLPGGGSTLFLDACSSPSNAIPGDDNLGVLGEQPVDAAVQRKRDVAGQYTGISSASVIPTFEIIATVASS